MAPADECRVSEHTKTALVMPLGIILAIMAVSYVVVSAVIGHDVSPLDVIALLAVVGGVLVVVARRRRS